MLRLYSELGLGPNKDLSSGKSRGKSLQLSKSEHGARLWLVVILSLGLMPVQNGAAIAQGAAPKATQSEVLKACDLAAASPYDKQRPTDVPGVFANAFNPSVAIPACEAAVRAAPQDPRMLFELGRGYNGAKKFAQALPLYGKAVQMGNALAANDLALMYENGEGVAVDLKAGVYYLNQAAQAGLSIAQSNLGLRYLYGNAAVLKNESVARQWISLAAKDNYPQAMYNFGLMLDKGAGGQKDSSEARKWIEKAANVNYPGATTRLGWMFQNGRGGPQDFEEARRLYKKAIALGETQYAAKYLAELDQSHPATTRSAPAGTQAPVSGPTPRAFVAGATSFVMVNLQPNVVVEDVNAFLQAYHATLVEGPNADGLCKLRLAEPLPAGQLQLFLDSMRTQTKIVRSATSG